LEKKKKIIYYFILLFIVIFVSSTNIIFTGFTWNSLLIGQSIDNSYENFSPSHFISFFPFLFYKKKKNLEHQSLLNQLSPEI